MKRIALLTVLLLAIGLASGFAADPIVPIMSSVSAEVQWGVDLDSGVTGFANTPTLTIYLPLITYGSMNLKGDGDFYGAIDLTNIELGIAYNVLPVNPATGNPGTGFNNGIQVYWVQKVDTAVDATAATAAAAYIVAKPWNMAFGVYAAPSMALGHGIYLSQTDAIYGTIALGTAPGTAIAATLNPVVPVSQTAAILATPYGVNGTYLEYGAIDAKPINIFVKVLSSGDWTGANVRGYAFGVDGTLAFDPLTVGFGAYQGFNPPAPNPVVWPDAPTQMYLTLGLAQEMGASKVAADVKADMQLKNSVFDYELSADAFFYMSAANDKDGKPQYVNWITANVLYGSATTYNDLSAHFAVVEDATNGFLPGLGAKVEGNLVNIMHAFAYDVIANASYKVAVNPDISLTPGVVFWYGKPFGAADAILHLVPSVTVSLGMVQNTTFAVVWTGLDLLPEPPLKAQYGVINVNATITW